MGPQSLKLTLGFKNLIGLRFHRRKFLLHMYQIKGKIITSRILKSSGKILMMRLSLKPKPLYANLMSRNNSIIITMMPSSTNTANIIRYHNILFSKLLTSYLLRSKTRREKTSVRLNHRRMRHHLKLFERNQEINPIT